MFNWFGFLKRGSWVAAAVIPLVACSVDSEQGTWSIVAVDRASGQVGVAGASCTYNVQGIGEVVPGVGAVVVQGMSSDEAREFGIQQLRNSASPSDIVRGMREARFDPANQQYAVVSIDPSQSAATFSGDETDGWRGSAVGDGVSVQGNSLVGEQVVSQTLTVFESTEGPLAERLVEALAAGAAAGGDKRCGEQRARSAFVTVFNPDDPDPTPYFHLVVYGIEKGGEPAVDRLTDEFQALFPRSRDRSTTRLYVIPGG